jgi:hypothetical protein
LLNRGPIEYDVEIKFGTQSLFRETSTFSAANMGAPIATSPQGVTWCVVSTETKTYQRQVNQVVELPDAEGTLEFRARARMLGPFTCAQAIVEVMGTNFQFILDESPISFRPRDSSDTPAVSQCSDPSLRGQCYPQYQARIVPQTIPVEEQGGTVQVPLPSGTIAFTLSDRTNLTGRSINDGDDTGPDYVIEPGAHQVDSNVIPSAGRDSASTGSPAQSAKVVVSSKDYGGKARLRATLSIPKHARLGGDGAIRHSTPGLCQFAH